MCVTRSPTVIGLPTLISSMRTEATVVAAIFSGRSFLSLMWAAVVENSLSFSFYLVAKPLVHSFILFAKPLVGSPVSSDLATILPPSTKVVRAATREDSLVSFVVIKSNSYIRFAPWLIHKRQTGRGNTKIDIRIPVRRYANKTPVIMVSLWGLQQI